MELILVGTRLASTATDFQLVGVKNLAGVADGNELRVTMHHVIGSGPRTNIYGDMSGESGHRKPADDHWQASTHSAARMRPS